MTTEYPWQINTWQGAFMRLLFDESQREITAVAMLVLGLPD
jgi:hypothetical protein